MSTELKRAVQAIKAGDTETGRKILHHLLQENPDNEFAWIWLAKTTSSVDEQRQYLEKALRINPHNEAAQKAMSALQKQLAVPQTAPPAPSPAEPVISSSSMFEVTESLQAPDGTKVDVLQFTRLQGSADVRTAERLFYATQSGMRLKMIRITLHNSHVRVEPGSLYYMKGRPSLGASGQGAHCR